MRLPFLGLAALSLVACGGGTPEPPPPNVPTLPPPPAAAPVPPPVATEPAKPAVPDDKKKCDDSRAKRVADDKDMMATRISKALLFKGTGKQVRANCKLASDRPFTPLERSGSGWNITADMRDSVKCNGALPGGVTKDDAYLLLASERGGDKPAFTSGPILAAEEHHPDDQKCASYDKAVGLDLFAPQYGDEASVKKVLEWKAP